MSEAGGPVSRRRRRMALRAAATLGFLAAASFSAVIAFAFWGGNGNGIGAADVGTLTPSSTVSASSVSNTVTLNWSAVTPPDGALTGYYVTRQQGGSSTPACGTVPGTPASYIPPSTLTCSDLGVPNQAYTYTVTAVFRSWTAESGSSNVVTVIFDPTSPTQSVTLGAGASNGYLGGAVLYFRSAAAGNFQLVSTVSDAGSGPASASFPGVSTSGWTHAAETVSSGSGTGPIAYTSSPYTWTAGASGPGSHTITGRDAAGNTVDTILTFAADNAAPTSGALTVNGVAATGAGSNSFDRSGSFGIGSRTDYTDAASGISSSVLTVRNASLGGNTCGTFGSATILTGSPAQSGLTTGCWRYTLTGTDNVGNTNSTSTTVKVDLFMPTSGALTVNGTAATAAGSASSTNASSFNVDARTDWTDGESGMASSDLTRTTAPYVAGSCGTYGSATTLTGTPSQSGLATSCYRYTLTGTDNAGNVITVSTVVRNDTTAPASGALTVNGVAASAAGSTSTSNSPSFTIGTRTDYTDAASGMASSTLTREFASLSGTTCGTFGSSSVVTGTPTQTGLATGCYRYQLTGTDDAGNVVSLSTTVSVRVYVTAASLLNGTGVAGKVDDGDRFEITYSDSIAVSTLCSTWSGDGVDQSLTGNNQVTVRLNDGGAGNDTITVTTTACTFNLGTIDLGSSAYTTSTVTFGGGGSNKSTIAWSASGKKLTITMGRESGAGAAVVATSTPTVTPSTLVTNVNAVPAGGTFIGVAARQF